MPPLSVWCGKHKCITKVSDEDEQVNGNHAQHNESKHFIFDDLGVLLEEDT